MIDGENRVKKGVIKDEDGRERQGVMDAYIQGRYLVLELHTYENIEYTWESDEKKVLGKPMQKTNKSPGSIKFLLNDMCTYIDSSGMKRVIDLDKFDAFSTTESNVSINRVITEW